MNTALFIARRMIFNSSQKGRISRPIVKIAVWGIALGMAVMILTLGVVTGFQKEIRDKVVGFGSHIQITNYDANNSLEPSPLTINPALIHTILQIPGVMHLQRYAIKAGIIKTQDDLMGVVIKGIGNDFNWDFFKRNIIEALDRYFRLFFATQQEKKCIADLIQVPKAGTYSRECCGHLVPHII